MDALDGRLKWEVASLRKRLRVIEFIFITGSPYLEIVFWENRIAGSA